MMRVFPMRAPLFVAVAAFVACVLLSQSAHAQPVRNFSEAFHARKGLEGMTPVDYERMRVVNVREMGAKGDGREIENVHFDRALQALKEQGGGVLYVPEGRYRFKSPLSIEAQRRSWSQEGLVNIHIAGDGPERTIIFTDWDALRNSGDPAPYLWSFTLCEDITIRDMGFSVFPYLPMRSPREGEGVFLISLSRSTNVRIVNVRCDQGRMGIVCWVGNRNCWVVDCDVRNTGADAIKFDSCNDIVAAYNYIECNNDDGFSGLRMAAGPSSNNAFLYNTLVYNRGWGRGIAISGVGHRIVGNWIESQGMPAVLLHQIGFGKDVPKDDNSGHVVAENTFVRCNLIDIAPNTLIGHRLGATIAGLHPVSNVEIRDNLIAGSANDGIGFRSSQVRVENCRIEGNTIVGNLGNGIGLAMVGPNNLATGVHVRNNTLVRNSLGSILLAGRIEGFVSESNRITDHGRFRRSDKDLQQYIHRPAPGTNSQDEIIRAVPVGCALGPVESDYTDIYHTARTAASETEWLAPPTSAVEGPIVNVRDFGARGDGKGSDTVAFRKAIAALPETGGVLKVPTGTYRIEPEAGQDTLPHTVIRHHLVIRDCRNVHLIGEGEGSILQFTSLGHEGLRLVGVKRASIRNMTLEVTAQSPHRMNRSPLDLVACEDVVLQGIISRRSAGYGIRIDSCRSVLVEGCRVESAGQVGIALLATRQAVVRNCDVRDSRDNGIHVNSVGGIARMPECVSIENNRIEGAREGYGVSINHGDRVRVTANQIRDTYLAGVGVYYVNAIFPVQRLAIRDNHLTQCARGELSYARGAITMLYVRPANRKATTTADVLMEGNFIEDTPAGGIAIDRCGDLGRLVLRNNRFEKVGGESVMITETQRAAIKELVVE